MQSHLETFEVTEGLAIDLYFEGPGTAHATNPFNWDDVDDARFTCAALGITKLLSDGDAATANSGADLVVYLTAADLTGGSVSPPQRVPCQLHYQAGGKWLPAGTKGYMLVIKSA